MPIVIRAPDLDRVEWKMVGDRGVVFCKASGMVWLNLTFIDRVSTRRVAKRIAYILNRDPEATCKTNIKRYLRIEMMEEQAHYNQRHAPRGRRT